MHGRPIVGTPAEGPPPALIVDATFVAEPEGPAICLIYAKRPEIRQDRGETRGG
jgi:hypothetical protein